MTEGVEAPTISKASIQPAVVIEAKPAPPSRPKVDIQAILSKEEGPEGLSNIDSSVPGTRTVLPSSVDSNQLKNEPITKPPTVIPGETPLTVPDTNFRSPEFTEFADNGRGIVNENAPASTISKTNPTEVTQPAGYSIND